LSQHKIFELFSSLQSSVGEVISRQGNIKCIFCGAQTNLVTTRVKNKIIKVCSNCGYNYSFDWDNQDLVSDVSIYAFLESLKDKKRDVSIIILSYNSKDITKKCLLSLSQIINPFELVIVDNGSKDGLREWLTELKSKISHKNLKVILNDENMGVAAGRNLGAKASSGDYLLFLDNDMIMLNKFDLNMLKSEIDSDKIQTGLFHGQHNAYYFVLGGFSMIRRKDFLKLGMFDTIWGNYWFDDTDFTLKALKESGRPASIVNNKEYVYHIAGASYMRNNSHKVIAEDKSKKLAILDERWKNIVIDNKLTFKNNLIQFEVN